MGSLLLPLEAKVVLLLVVFDMVFVGGTSKRRPSEGLHEEYRESRSAVGERVMNPIAVRVSNQHENRNRRTNVDSRIAGLPPEIGWWKDSIVNFRFIVATCF